VESSFDLISKQARWRRKALVVQQSAKWEALSNEALMTGGTFDRLFWTKTLDRLNLESPGREEAVNKAIETVRKKKEVIEAIRKQKGTKGRKKK
jgi:hypothetical protein